MDWSWHVISVDANGKWLNVTTSGCGERSQCVISIVACCHSVNLCALATWLSYCSSTIVVAAISAFPRSAYVGKHIINTLASSVRIYCTLKPVWNQAVFMCPSNSIALRPIVLESCANLQKTRQVFESAMKKKFWFWVSCFLWVTS